MLQRATPSEIAAADMEYRTSWARVALGGMKWGLLLAVAFSLLAGVYLHFAEPVYSARSVLMISARKIRVLDQQSILGDLPIDSAAIESQVQVLRSENLAKRVIDQLDLADDPDFMKPSLLGRLIDGAISFWPWPEMLSTKRTDLSEIPPTDKLIEAFRRRLSVSRVGISYVIEVRFDSTDPQRAADVANAVATLYVEDERSIKAEAARLASDWLLERVQQLKSAAIEEERKSLDYRTSTKALDPIVMQQLEASARIHGALYESFLQRYTEALQQQSSPVISDTRIISTAIAPSSPVKPKPLILIGGAVVAGLGLGFGASAMRRMERRG